MMDRIIRPERCIICRGRGTITLPIHRPVSITPPTENRPLDLSYTTRTYACPECAEKVGDHEVCTALITNEISVRAMGDPKHLDYVKRDMAVHIGDFLIREGLVTFDTLESQRTRSIYDEMTVTLTASLGVVARKSAEKIEGKIKERIRNRQWAMVEKVIKIAKDQLNGWVAYYSKTGTPLTYNRVNEALDDAYAEVKHRIDG